MSFLPRLKLIDHRDRMMIVQLLRYFLPIAFLLETPKSSCFHVLLADMMNVESAQWTVCRGFAR